MMDFIEICSTCGGQCCKDANPPLSQKRLEILFKSGVERDKIHFGKYVHPKAKEDGYCIFFEKGMCTIHRIKPETCVAGPFTFDLKGEVLEIYIKTESICPLVRYLKENEEAYRVQFEIAVEKIITLINDLDEQSLSEILKIEEPETVKVAEIDLREFRK
ncbi:MAG: YkgJ family cysteine cluster protein [Archaeoglobaceae archaeon]